MFSKNKIAMLVAEFLGTGVLALIVVSVQRSTIGVPYFVGLAAGLAAAMLVVVFGRSSGAHLNPAITIGMWTARRIRTLEAILYVAVQLLGGYLAGRLYSYLINNNVAAVSHAFTGRVLVAEAVGALILAFAWAAATFIRSGDDKKAALVGSGYALGIIAAASASVGIINPAVALGANAWVWATYVLGPVLGAVIGINLYGLLFAPAGAFMMKPARANASVSTTSKAAPKRAAAKKSTTKRKTTKRK